MANSTFCTLCDLENEDPEHESRHKFNFVLFEWNIYRKALVKDRDGIKITQSVRNNKILPQEQDFLPEKGKFTVTITPQKFINICKSVKVEFVIENARNDSIFVVWIGLLHPITAYRLEDTHGISKTKKFASLKPKEKYSVFAYFEPRSVNIGDYKIQLAIKFHTIITKSQPAQQFTFFRELQVTIKDTLNEIAEPFQPFKSELWGDGVKISPALNKPQYRELYPIPEEYQNIFYHAVKSWDGMTHLEQSNLLYIRSRLCENYRNGYGKFEPKLTRSNYKDFFHFLLWMDEICEAESLKQYTMSNVKLKKVNADLLKLEVLGLAEKRPSLLAGDSILIRLHGEDRAFEGIVQTVNDKSIWINGLDPEVLFIVECEPDEEFDVCFRLGRLNFERKHKGVENCIRQNMYDTLFPPAWLQDRVVPMKYQLRSSEDFYNKSVMENPEQKAAVLNILNETAFPAPFIVFGPPGTGKTVTIVESILQIKKLKPKAKILICAPANAACDMLCTKLSNYCSPQEMIRVHAQNRNWDDVPGVVKKYSNRDKLSYKRIEVHQLSEYSIVITTLVLIGKYVGKYSPNFVFIDEAAQAMEPEADIAISLLSAAKVVLAGDPKQLGPICASRVAGKHGLALTMLDRLMKTNNLYANFDPRFISMLKLNYRAHPSVLHVPNYLFYENKLQAINQSAKHDPIAQLCVYALTSSGRYNHQEVRKGFPVEFCSVIALEKRQGKSPSYYNLAEIEMVAKYVCALLEQKTVAVTQSDVGVIAPYIRQVHRVKEELRRNGYKDVEVGTTEAYQGSEKRIIIISTVRGRNNLMLYDKKYNLGFVNNEKRMNVALTRAKSKLIVIGNPTVLNTDNPKCKNWRYFIEYCQRNNSSYGMPYARRTKEIRNEINNRIMVHRQGRYDVPNGSGS